MTVQPDPGDDDLTRIPGIGSRIAAQLRDAGITSLDQLARSTVEQVTSACGSRGTAVARAQAWIEQAAELVDRGASEVGAEPAGRARLLPRRTFTVEVRVDDDSAHVVTTRVVHLETQDEDAWSGWSRSRLLDFIEIRIGAADLEPSPEPASPAPTQPAAAGGAPSPPTLTIHRFGLLKAATLAAGRGETAARLRLDPADLDLPPGRTSVAQVELLARPAGAGRAEVLDTRMIDLAADRALDAVLRGRLPDRDPPFAVFATVRVLVDQPSGPPREGLGSGTLEIATGGDPVA